MARFNGSAQQWRQYMPGSRGCNTELYSVRRRNSRRSGFRAVRSAIESGPSRPWRQGSAWRTRCRPLAAGCSVPRTGIAGDVHHPVRFGLPVAGLTDLVSLARCPACPSSPGYRCRAVPMWGRLGCCLVVPLFLPRCPGCGFRRRVSAENRSTNTGVRIAYALSIRLSGVVFSRLSIAPRPQFLLQSLLQTFSTNPSRRP